MGQPIDFAGSNMCLVPADGTEERVQEMRTFTNGICSVSCWQLSPEEVAQIVATTRVFVTVLSGRTQPPVYVGDERMVRAVVEDCGGSWVVPS